MLVSVMTRKQSGSPPRFPPPLANRLNTAAPGANLTTKDIYNLMALCPYDSLACMRLSPLCQLFADEEFKLFEYANDIDKYYGTG